jgi:hypothetical protein
MSFAYNNNKNIISEMSIKDANELVKFSKVINQKSKIAIFLGMVVNDNIIIYCSEKDPQGFLRSTVLNKTTKKIILDNQIVSSYFNLV